MMPLKLSAFFGWQWWNEHDGHLGQLGLWWAFYTFLFFSTHKLSIILYIMVRAQWTWRDGYNERLNSGFFLGQSHYFVITSTSRTIVRWYTVFAVFEFALTINTSQQLQNLLVSRASKSFHSDMILILILAISLQKARQWTVSLTKIRSFDRIWMLMMKLDIAGLYEVRLAKENPNAGQVQYR